MTPLASQRRGVREWLVIESSMKNAVFSPPEAQKPRGYIPRDAAEKLLGCDLGGTYWFTQDQSDKMRAHPEWRDTEPHGATAREQSAKEQEGRD